MQKKIIAVLATTDIAVLADRALIVSPEAGYTFIALVAAAFLTNSFIPGFDTGNTTESAADPTVETVFNVVVRATAEPWPPPAWAVIPLVEDSVGKDPEYPVLGPSV